MPGPVLDRRALLQGSTTLAVVAGWTRPGLSEASVATPFAERTPRLATPLKRGPNWYSLNDGWRFHLGDISQRVTGHRPTVNSAKAGGATGPAAPAFDDTEWRAIDLPHDWVVEGPFSEGQNIAQGYRPRGVAWYRRALRLEEADRGKHLELQFDGIASHATIWFNGTLIRRSWSGYTSSYVDVTPYATYGDRPNLVAVRVDAEPNEGWWYEGGGVYRHVWLVKRSPVHIVTDGLYAMPRREGPADRWSIPVEATLRNSGAQARTATVDLVVVDPAGRALARGRTSVALGALDEAVARLELIVDSPRLWSVDAPNLYDVRAEVTVDGAPVDQLTVTTGFRTIRFDPERGFHLNGQPLKIKGACIHQDHAGVGVAVPDALLEFRLRRLREMGANAIRMSHHAPAAELLDLADRLGFLVMDENRAFNVDRDTSEQLEWLVRRDRNHPSVFAWSIFNEEPLQGAEVGYELARRMIEQVKDLDDSRPVTAAMHGGMNAPRNVSQLVDLVGINYQTREYDPYHKAHPDRPLISTEDASAFMTRGALRTDRSRNVFADDDREAAPWGATNRAAWKAIDERPFMAGGFVWTGFDYRGEPTPFSWPSASTFFGAMDLCGFAKTGFLVRQALWIKDRPILHLAPHWTWPGRDGEPIRILAITNADEVEISLNGRRLGRAPVDPYMMAEFETPYAPGRLDAVAYKAGRVVARTSTETAGPPKALRLAPYRPALAADGRDAVPMTVSVVDARSRAVPTAAHPVSFEITGGRIIGVGNGDPNSHQPEKGSRRSLFNGLAQVIVQADGGGPGKLRLNAQAPGLRPAAASMQVVRTPERPGVPRAPTIQVIDRWRQSPPSLERPDPGVVIPDYDFNSWAAVTPGEPSEGAAAPSWTLIRAQFLPHAALRRRGGTLTLHGVSGLAEVWLDGKRVADGPSSSGGPLRVWLAPGEGDRTVTLLFRASPSQRYGLTHVVTLELDGRGAPPVSRLKESKS